MSGSVIQGRDGLGLTAPGFDNKNGLALQVGDVFPFGLTPKGVPVYLFGNGDILIGHTAAPSLVPSVVFMVDGKRRAVGDGPEDGPGDFIDIGILSFKNVESLDVVIGQLQELRESMTEPTTDDD